MVMLIFFFFFLLKLNEDNFGVKKCKCLVKILLQKWRPSDWQNVLSLVVVKKAFKARCSIALCLVMTRCNIAKRIIFIWWPIQPSANSWDVVVTVKRVNINISWLGCLNDLPWPLSLHQTFLPPAPAGACKLAEEPDTPSSADGSADLSPP